MSTGEGATTPLSNEAFAAALTRLGVEGPVAIAVSGGRDSMALALLAAQRQKTTGHCAIALIVDHQLRDGSRKEAESAASWCAALGLPAKLLIWDGPKPEAGRQAAARAARYRLLCAACEKAGVSFLLTAHTADDQAETLFMRLARGAGPKGLSAMREEQMIADGAGAPIRLVRPLLAFTRAQTTSLVQQHGQTYVDDPGNDDPAFERIRTRALLAALEEQGLLTRAALLRSAARMQWAARAARRRDEAAFQLLGGCFYRWGGATIEAAFCDRTPSCDLDALFASLIYAVSGEEFPPDAAAAHAVRAQAAAQGAATLGGALVKHWRGRIWFLREPGAVLGRTGKPPRAPAPLPPGARLVWDRRFILQAHNEAPAGAEIAPLGKAGADFYAARLLGPQEALVTSPAVFYDGALYGAPALCARAPFTAHSLATERFQRKIIRFL